MTAQAAVRIDPQSGDEAAVRSLYQQCMDGWNAGSGEAFAAAFAEDGHLVAFDGTHFESRRDMVSFHQPLFDKWLKGTRLVGHITNVQFLAPDVALMHVLGGTIMRGKATPSPVRDSIQTLVAIRRNGQWKLAAFQNTRRRPIGPGIGSVLVWTITDWLWTFLRRKSEMRG